MSRIGSKLIPLPQKVSATIQAGLLEIKGPQGTLTRRIPEGVQVKIEKDTISVHINENEPQFSNLHGLVRTLVANMVQGVVQPWKKDLEIQGVGYRANKNGQVLNLQLGYSHPIDFKVPPIIQFTVDAKQVMISLSSPDKELLGDIAAQIRSLRPPEPYQGKGIRYAGEHILRKAGKAAATVGAGGGAKK